MSRNALGTITNTVAGRASLAPQKANSVVSTTSAMTTNSNGGNNNNNRVSIAAAPRNSSIGSRASMAPRASSIGARLSMAPGGGGRRSTLSSQVAGKASEDPRPLKENQFKTAAIHRIVEYLVVKGYDKTVTAKMLTAPSSKDYLSIMLFLFQQFDMSFQYGPKPDEDIVMTFKRLRYPFTINKSHVASAGAMHSWPSLLGAMIWLVELLEYFDRLSSAESMSDFAQPENSEKSFFEYLNKSYTMFMKGIDDDSVDRELIEGFEVKSRQLSQEVEQISLANQGLREQVEQYKQSPLESLNEKKVMLLADYDKFQKHISQLETHVAQAEKKVEELKVEAIAKEDEIGVITRENADLTAQIARQPVSAADVQRMTQERNQLRERQQAGANIRDNAKENMFAAEVRVSKKLADVERDIHEYRATATKLKLIPATAKRAGGMDYDIRVGGVNAIDEVLALNCKTGLKPQLDDLKTKIVQKFHGLMEESSELEMKAKTIEDDISEKRGEIQRLEARVDKLDNEQRKDKETREAEITTMTTEAAAIEEEALRARADVTQRLAKAKKELDSLTLEQQSQQVAFEMEDRQMHDSLSTILSTIASHKLHIQESIKELKNEVAAIAAEVQS